MADAADSADARSGAGVAAPAALGPADVGAWRVLPFHSEVLAVHAALLPSGDVLFAAGSGNSLTRFQSPDFGDIAKRIWVSVAWDPTISPPPGSDTNFFHPATPHDGAGKVLDFFCGGETFLPDGRLLSAGGTLVFAHPGAGFAGRPDTVVFDPATEQWAGRHSMAHGRWYPSLINLGDGPPTVRWRDQTPQCPACRRNPRPDERKPGCLPLTAACLQGETSPRRRRSRAPFRRHHEV